MSPANSRILFHFSDEEINTFAEVWRNQFGYEKLEAILKKRRSVVCTFINLYLSFSSSHLRLKRQKCMKYKIRKKYISKQEIKKIKKYAYILKSLKKNPEYSGLLA